MSLEAKIQDEIKAAMLAKEKVKLEALRAIKAAGGRLTVNGYAGWAFTLYSASGMAVADFTATTNSHTATPAVPAGAYILKGCCGGEAVTVKVKL